MDEQDKVKARLLLDAYFSVPVGEERRAERILCNLTPFVRAIAVRRLNTKVRTRDRRDAEDAEVQALSDVAQKLMQIRIAGCTSRIDNLERYVIRVTDNALSACRASHKSGWSIAAGRLECLNAAGFLPQVEIPKRKGPRAWVRLKSPQPSLSDPSGERLCRVLEDADYFLRAVALDFDLPTPDQGLQALVIVRLLEWLGQPILWNYLVTIYAQLMKLGPANEASLYIEDLPEMAATNSDPAVIVPNRMEALRVAQEIWSGVLSLRLNQRRVYLLHYAIDGISIVYWLTACGGMSIEEIAAAIEIAPEILYALRLPLEYAQIEEVTHQNSKHMGTWLLRAHARLAKRWAILRRDANKRRD
jgi:hypothetical protein